MTLGIVRLLVAVRSMQRNYVSDSGGILFLSACASGLQLSTERVPLAYRVASVTCRQCSCSSAILLTTIHTAGAHRSTAVRASTRVETRLLSLFQRAETLSLWRGADAARQRVAGGCRDGVAWNSSPFFATPQPFPSATKGSFLWFRVTLAGGDLCVRR